MRRFVLVHAIVLGLCASGCASNPTGVKEPQPVSAYRGVQEDGKTQRKQQEGQFVAGAAIPDGGEEQQETPPPPAQSWHPPKESRAHKIKRETRRAVRDTARFGRDVVIAVAVGVGIAVGVVLVIWGASQSE